MGRMRFSSIEKDHLLRAWLAISLAFAIAMVGFHFNLDFVMTLIISSVTVGAGFLLHELAHKFVAQHFGCFAEFRANMHMLLLAILISFTGFIFAAPGAVLISGHINNRKNGIISAAGPATNIVLALFFLNFSLFSIPFLATIGSYGTTINAWLALFNMIPFGGLDGAKVLHWDKRVYALILVAALIILWL